MRIAMALVENNGMDSRVHQHFGHVQLIGVYDTSKKELNVMEVKPVQGCSPIAALEGHKVDAIDTFERGMRAIELCGKMGIKLKTGTFRTVKEVVSNFDRLEDLEGRYGR